MRVFATTVSAFLILATLAPVAARSASAPAQSGFVAWALNQGSQCDERWNVITSADAAVSGSRDGTTVEVRATVPTLKTGPRPRLDHSVLRTTSFIHERSENPDYLPLTTRPRSSASRGMSVLESPASARISMPGAALRPLNSSVQQKHYIPSFGTSISRPRLNSFGHISTTARHGLGTPTRPASRVARPRIL